MISKPKREHRCGVAASATVIRSGQASDGDRTVVRPPARSALDDEFLDARELATRWRCSPKTLRNHRYSRDRLPLHTARPPSAVPPV